MVFAKPKEMCGMLPWENGNASQSEEFVSISVPGAAPTALQHLLSVLEIATSSAVHPQVCTLESLRRVTRAIVKTSRTGAREAGMTWGLSQMNKVVTRAE